MASLSTCHLGLWLGWQILLNLVKLAADRLYSHTINCWAQWLCSSTTGLSVEGDRGANVPYAISKLGQLCSLHLACVFWKR